MSKNIYEMSKSVLRLNILPNLHVLHKNIGKIND